MNIYDPTQWADAEGYWLFTSVLVLILVRTLLLLVPTRWDDWIDERSGRGSIHDSWSRAVGDTDG